MAVTGTKNQRAFLDMLAWSEGTSTSKLTKNDGYDVIVNGYVNGKSVPEAFTDYSVHPFSKGRPSKVFNSKGATSSASGRYQFMLRDYAHYRDLLKLPDFGPESQDRWALQLIKERGALADIEAGRIEAAIMKCGNIWASLPNNRYGQFQHSLANLVASYTKAGGGTTA